MSACLSCGGALAEVVNLGRLYLPDFTDPGEPRGERYPLRLMLCDWCTLLQLGDIVPREAVIHERYGFASGLNEANVADLRSIAEYAMQHVPEPGEWLDIGCNDGTLLAAVPRGVHRTGVDPLAKFAAEASTHADRIIIGYFQAGDFSRGEFDVITSTAMFYALPDPGAFAEDVRKVLAPGGAWVIQQNYALDMLRNNVIDNVIHEHVAYYTVRSLSYLLRRHGLEITDVAYSDPGIKGGCVRTLVSHRGARPVSGSVQAALRAEAGAEQAATWKAWGGTVRAELERSAELLRQLAAQGRPAYCYGAGNRGGTLVQLLGPETMPFAVERSPSKVGKVWTSAGIPIISEEQMRADRPDHLLISPWFFRDGFVRRERAYLESGGSMIFPLPHFEVVTA
jgi:NDP-4-keto-2,6-dideoxyhexose 3-C-methyltransferase